MKKILVFGMTENPGGMEAVVMNYYRHLPQNRIHIDFLINEKNMAYENEVVEKGSRVYKITPRSENVVKFKKEVTHFFKQYANQYDVFWFNTCSLANITYLKLAKKYGMKQIIVHCHNSQNMDNALRGLLHRLNQKNVQKYATDFWTCSADANEWFFGKNAKNLNIQVVQNAIDVSKYEFNEQVRHRIRQNLGIKDTDIILGNVGRLHFQKNQTFLLDVFAQLVKINKHYQLILVGEGAQRTELENKVKELQLTKNVHLVGIQNNVADWLSVMDLFVFPSLFEGLPIAALEAQANGVPIIASTEGLKNIAVLNKNVVTISLTSSIDTWIQAIISSDLTREIPKNIQKQFDNAKFSIQTCAKSLAEKLGD